ncbi:MAG: hypothetical protein WDA65_06740 [Christensenellales bacterium]
MGDIIDSENLALLIPLFAIYTKRSINDPAKASVIGEWVSAFGDTLSAMADTDTFIRQKEEEKKKIIKEIDELQKKLAELNK